MFEGSITIKCSNGNVEMEAKGLSPIERFILLASAIKKVEEQPDFAENVKDFFKDLLTIVNRDGKVKN